MQSPKLQLKVKNFINEHKFIILLILVSLFLRLYKFQELFLYSHDQDLAGWIIKDIVIDKHIRLIGQETSTQGFFIGPLFYYLLTPFYLIFKMDPIGGVFLVAILGILTTFSFYFVLARVFNKTTALIAAALHAISFYTVFTEREVVPTMLVFFWSVWFFYSLNLLLKGKQKYAYPLLGVLVGLIWNLIFALILVLPLIPLAQYLSKKKVNLKNLFSGGIALLISSLPFWVFELRHNFLQTRALISALTTNQQDIVTGLEKLQRTIHLVSKDLAGFLWGSTFNIRYEYVFLATLLIFVSLSIMKVFPRGLALIMTVWISAFILFFSLYSKILSEYYFNGIMVIWIIVFASGLYLLLSQKRFRVFGLVALAAFAYVNLNRIFFIPLNRSGYLYKKAIVSEIKRDAQERSFPCVSVSYITDPGYEFGYRYFFWLAKLHVNRPNSGSPVYTIVYPLKPIFPEHKAFGAIGLIYPDYKRYTREAVVNSCSGQDSNLTDPMFGYVD